MRWTATISTAVALLVTAQTTIALELQDLKATVGTSMQKEVPPPCSKEGVTLQILGSGGPFAGDRRASSGYLIWSKGRPMALFDAGGGTYLRLQQAGARIDDIKLIGISHFHPDHASDLPALLWSDLYTARKSPLVISGPAGKDTKGLGGFLKAAQGMFGLVDLLNRLKLVESEAQKKLPIDIYDDGEMKAKAIGVSHFDMPTLAYRLDLGGVSIGYGADQNLNNPVFTNLVQGVDVLILHLAVAENATLAAIGHAIPSIVGKIAQEAGTSTLVLSHFIKLDPSKPRASELSLADLDANAALVKKYFTGAIILAEDLQCIEVKKAADGR